MYEIVFDIFKSVPVLVEDEGSFSDVIEQIAHHEEHESPCVFLFEMVNGVHDFEHFPPEVAVADKEFENASVDVNV